MSDEKPKFQIGDIVILSDTPTKRCSQVLEKLRFYTITNYKKGSELYVYRVNGFDNYWFGERNFDLYSRIDNKWIPFKECNNIEVGDYVKLNNKYYSRSCKEINNIFEGYEYKTVTEVGNEYVFVESTQQVIPKAFLLFKKPNVSQIKPEIDKYEGGICNIDSAKENVTETYVISDITIIDFSYGENTRTHDCNASPEDEQIFDAMQKTLDAAKYSAFPFGSPDYLMNVKFGGSYNKK